MTQNLEPALAFPRHPLQDKRQPGDTISLSPTTIASIQTLEVRPAPGKSLRRKTPMRLLVCSLLLASIAPIAIAQSPATPTSEPLPVLTAVQAAEHVGEHRTVCGRIVNVYVASSSHGTPTFVDIDEPYPHPIFDFVIWGDDKDTVGRFPKSGKICASGKITLFKDRPQILLNDWHSWYVPN
jgi:hypothetical protein